MTLLLSILSAVTPGIAKCALACAPSHANVKVAVSASQCYCYHHCNCKCYYKASASTVACAPDTTAPHAAASTKKTDLTTTIIKNAK